MELLMAGALEVLLDKGINEPVPGNTFSWQKAGRSWGDLVGCLRFCVPCDLDSENRAASTDKKGPGSLKIC